MSFQKPTLSELTHRIRTDIASLFNYGSRNTTHDKLGIALAALSYGLYNYIDIVAKQITPMTSTGEYLQRWFDLFNINKKTAQNAKGQILINSTTTIVLPGRSVFQAPNGNQYETVTVANLVANQTTNVDVIATESGYKYNLASGKILDSSTIHSLKAVSDEISLGADEETEADMQARLINRMRYGNGSGTAGDYISWSLEVSGVARAWCNPSQFAVSTIKIYIATKNKRDPTASQVLLHVVDNHLQQYIPIGIEKLYLLSVTPNNLDIEITTEIIVSAQEKMIIETRLANYIYNNYSLDSVISSDDFNDFFDTQIYKYKITQQGGNLACLGDVTWIKVP